MNNARGPDRAGLSFSVEAARGDERRQWQDKVGEGGRGDRISDTARWLRQALGDGPMKAGEVLSLGEENGYTPRMLHHANSRGGRGCFPRRVRPRRRLELDFVERASRNPSKTHR